MLKSANITTIVTTLCLAIFFCSGNLSAANSAALSIDEYLAQVKGQNLAYTSSSQNAEAFELLKRKAELVTAVNLFASTQTGFAEQNQALQIFRYNKVYTQTSQVGITQTADFGLNTKLYYSLNHVTYKGLNTSNAANPGLASSNYQTTPTIELSLPLWQNFFGAATQALKESTYYTNEAEKLAAKSVSLSALVESEKSYWNLVAARRVIEIQKDALESARKIYEYVVKRERMNLGEKGDVLQAKALLETKKLALQQAENDEKIAARNFNKNRYIDSEIVEEKLREFDFVKLQDFLVPKVKAGNRFDLKSDEASMKAAVAAAKVEEENTKPSLNLYGSYSVNQIERSNAQAISSSFDEKGRSGIVGLKLSMPINFDLRSDIRRGAVKSASAAKTNFRQKTFEEANDWQNLVQNMASYKESLALATAIEKAQRVKLENERRLLKQGRTTTYQILLFEQDYSNSELTAIQIANRLSSLIAEEKLYHGAEIR